MNIATPPIWKFGTEEQKQRWLVPAIKGEKIGALGITEPDAGSDVAGIKTHAKRVDGGWLVNGSKTFITNGIRADFVVTAVKTTPEGGHHGLSFMVIEKGMDGFSVSRKLEKLGWHASDTRELSFKDCAVPEENLLGPRGQGFRQFLEILDGGRISVGAMGVGLAQGAYDLAFAYAQERKQFGRPISKFQAVQFKLADIATELEAAR